MTSDHQDARLERLLRDRAARVRDAQPPMPAIDESMLARGRAGGSISRRAVAVAASVAAVAIVAVCALVIGHSAQRSTPPATGGAVPWSSTGQHPAYFPDSSRQTDDLGGLAACDPARFAVVQSGTAREAHTTPGWLVTRFVLRSTASGACRFDPQHLQTALVGVDGRVLLDQALGRFTNGTTFPLRVAHGDTVAGKTEWAVAPARAPVPDRLVVGAGNITQGSLVPADLPTISLRGVVVPADPTPLNRSKGAAPWRSGWVDSTATVNTSGSPRSLTAHIVVPQRIRPTEGLRYTVVLSNPTPDPVTLAPCPQVVQTVLVVQPVRAGLPGQRGPAGGHDMEPPVRATAGTTGPLNCRAAPRSIAPHTALTFEFRLSAPWPTGSAELEWQLVVAPGVRIDVRAMFTVTA